MARYDIDPFGKMMETERWIAADKLNRQQIAKQNALRDIQMEQARANRARQAGIDTAISELYAPQQISVPRNALYAGPQPMGGEMVTEQIPSQPTYLDARRKLAQFGSQGLEAAESFKTDVDKTKPTPTDIDDYVSRGLRVYLSKSPNATDAERAAEGNRLALEFKRAQVDERRRLSEVDIETERRKKSQDLKTNRLYDDVAAGQDAADATASLRRGLQLIEYIGTGGVDKASLYAKQFFGVESADEAELSSLLGKAILAQLRSTFGAQFTEREGARLERIESNFGKSTAGNKRLLQNALTISERAARRGMRAAEKLGDDDLYKEIEDALNFELSDLDTPQKPTADKGVLPSGVTEEDIRETMRANNMTREQVLSRLRGR